jgi:hypothetical protein
VLGVAGGAGGIRTLDGLLTHTHFPGERLRPLGHRSACSGCRAALVRGKGGGKGSALAPNKNRIPELVEGLPFVFNLGKEKQSFDKLRNAGRWYAGE